MPEPEHQIWPEDLDICATIPLGANGLRAGEVTDASKLRCIGEDKVYL